MSYSIPIIVHILPENNLTHRLGSEVGNFLKNNNQINKIYTADNEFRRGRRFEASSRGGMMIYGLGELIDKAKLKNLDFISDKTHTHEIVATAYGMREIFRFSVINKNFDKIAEDITKLIEWSRENIEQIPEELLWDYGHDRDGRDFDTEIEAIDNVLPSLKPNDDICDADSNSLALAFSVLKTIRELLLYAKEMGYWVIVEHWGGFK
jgi:hypothetical protein